jgi:hypothetical protein
VGLRIRKNLGSNHKVQNTSPKHFNRPLSLTPQLIGAFRDTGLFPIGLITFSPEPHQGATAEQNHEDDEGLKPIVLHDEEAGFPQDPPRLA